nr:MAG TPA: hypothetical protein [Caudoviricetes sp.]
MLGPHPPIFSQHPNYGTIDKEHRYYSTLHAGALAIAGNRRVLLLIARRGHMHVSHDKRQASQNSGNNHRRLLLSHDAVDDAHGDKRGNKGINSLTLSLVHE